MPNIDLLPALRDLADGHRTAYASVRYGDERPEILYIGWTGRPNEPIGSLPPQEAWDALIDAG
jgi:hypothetical protein